MGELVPVQRNQAVRWHLLASVSAVALLVRAWPQPPSLWPTMSIIFYFELGGQYGMEAGGSTAGSCLSPHQAVAVKAER